MAMVTLDIFRSTVGAAALGFARHAMHEAFNRTKSRQIFGAPMSKLQLIQSKIGEMSLDIDASSLLIYRAAWTKDKGAEKITKEAAMAKLFATEAAQRVIDEAVQIAEVQVWFPDSRLNNYIVKYARLEFMKVRLKCKS